MNLRYGFWAYVVLLFVVIPSSLLRAFVLAACWRWFAMPLGLPALGWAHAYGLATMVNLAAIQTTAIKDKDIAEAAGVTSRDATGGEKFLWVTAHSVRMFVPSAAVLAFAYVTHLCM